MNDKYLDIVINKERLSNGSPVYVAHCTSLGIASQGKDIGEAVKNIREAVNLYLEENPGKINEIGLMEAPIFSVIEVKGDAKAASIIR